MFVELVKFVEFVLPVVACAFFVARRNVFVKLGLPRNIHVFCRLCSFKVC